MNDRGENPENAGYADWLSAVEGQLGPRVKTEGIAVEPLCTATHPDRSRQTRGPLERRSASSWQRPWVVTQSHAGADPEKLNHYFRDDAANGVQGVRLRTRGANGLNTRGAFESAFRDVERSWQTLILDSGAQFLAASAVALSWMGQQPRMENQVVLLGADPLRQLVEEGSLPDQIAVLEADLAALVRYSHEDLPRGRALAVSTEPFREAGADIPLELAAALALAIHYFRALESHGLELGQIAAEIAFFTSTGQQTFLEIAKLRALRGLWSHLLKACGIGSRPDPWIHASVLRRTLPTTTPETNVLRVTNAAMAAIVGGADSVETPGDGVARPRGASRDGDRRLARNIQHILGLEAHLGKVSDPAAGSYLIESTTDRLQEAGWTLFQQIEAVGGALEALSSGWLQDRVAERWEERRRQLQSGDLPLLGITVYADSPGGDSEPLRSGELQAAADTSESPVEETREGPPSDARRRWLWCLDQARQEVSISAMGSLLYDQGDGVTVRALHPHQDSEAQEETSS